LRCKYSLSEFISIRLTYGAAISLNSRATGAQRRELIPGLCERVAEMHYAEVLRVSVLCDLNHLMSQRLRHCRAGRHHCNTRHDAQNDVQPALHTDHITSRHITSCHVTLRHVTWRHVMSRVVTSHDVITATLVTTPRAMYMRLYRVHTDHITSRHVTW